TAYRLRHLRELPAVPGAQDARRRVQRALRPAKAPPPAHGARHVTEARVSPEELVASHTAERDRQAAAPGRAGDDERVEPVDRGLVHEAKDFVDVVEQLQPRHANRLMVRAEVPRSLLGLCRLVSPLLVEADRDGTDTRVDLGRERGQGARVDAAGQEESQGNVGDEQQADRLAQGLGELRYGGVSREGIRALGEPDLPVAAVSLLAPRPVEGEGGARCEEMDPFDEGVVAAYHPLREKALERRRRERPGHQIAPGREQGTQLRGEEEPAAGRPGPVEGLDTEAVSAKPD